MAEKTINTHLLVRSDTAINWETANPILKEKELAYDTTNKKFKIGDGVTAWSSLKYVPNIDLSNYCTKTEVETLIETHLTTTYGNGDTEQF